MKWKDFGDHKNVPFSSPSLESKNNQWSQLLWSECITTTLPMTESNRHTKADPFLDDAGLLGLLKKKKNPVNGLKNILSPWYSKHCVDPLHWVEMTTSFRVYNLTTFRNNQKPAQHLPLTHRKLHHHHPNTYIINYLNFSEMTWKLCRHVCLGFKI